MFWLDEAFLYYVKKGSILIYERYLLYLETKNLQTILSVGHSRIFWNIERKSLQKILEMLNNSKEKYTEI